MKLTASDMLTRFFKKKHPPPVERQRSIDDGFGGVMRVSFKPLPYTCIICGEVHDRWIHWQCPHIERSKEMLWTSCGSFLTIRGTT